MTEPTRFAGATPDRIGIAATAVVLVVLDLGLKAWARRALVGGASVDLPVIQLRLAMNSGMAFSLGDTLPSQIVLVGTGTIIAGLAVFAWRAAATANLVARLALAGVLAGAIGNLVDRAADGVVTDYLHTGWFPTFNLADIFITLGGTALVLTNLRVHHPDTTTTAR